MDFEGFVHLGEKHAPVEQDTPKPPDDLDIFDPDYCGTETGVPCTLTEFVRGAAFLNNPALSDIQYEAVRHLEQIYRPETHDLIWKYTGNPEFEPVRRINFATLQWGKGSGKDHICRIATLRIAYLLQCLKSPQRYFGLPEQDFIHTLNVAASATQAQRAFFRPMKDVVRNAPCFKGHARATEYSIVFDKNIEIVSGHSESETQEGLNLIFALADEISAFKTKEEAERFARFSGGREPAKTAEGILDMIRTSARTRFPENHKIAAISYPRFKGDAIQQLTAKGLADLDAKGAKSRHYVSGPYATWEVNPRIPDNAKETVFADDYESDPTMARAKYECKPDTSVNRAFRNDAAIYASFQDRRPEPVIVEYFWGKDEIPAGAREEIAPNDKSAEEGNAWQVRFHFSDDLVPMVGAIYALHGDIAITGDRAGVSMCHVRSWKEEEWANATGQEPIFEDRPIVKVDFVTSFEADIAAQPRPREVQIRWYRKLVWELIARGFNIMLVTFDGFQSADSIQILESWGLESDRVSVDRDSSVYDNLRDVMYDGRLEGYWRESVVEEIRALQKLPNGKIDHPPGGSKDESDALAGAVFGAVTVGGDEGEEPERADQPSDKIYDALGGGDSVMPSDWGFGKMDISWTDHDAFDAPTV